jgi:hypothetical protein
VVIEAASWRPALVSSIDSALGAPTFPRWRSQQERPGRQFDFPLDHHDIHASPLTVNRTFCAFDPSKQIIRPRK